MRQADRIDTHTPEALVPRVEKYTSDQVRASIQAQLKYAAALCLQIYASENVTLGQASAHVRQVRESSSPENIDVSMYSTRVARAFSTHMAVSQVSVLRQDLARESPDIARILDTALFDMMTMTTFIAHNGEDRVTMMEQSMEFQALLATRREGGQKSRVTRTAWLEAARTRYVDYRARNPGKRVATHILKEMDREGRVIRPSDKRLLALIREWEKADRPNADEGFARPSRG